VQQQASERVDCQAERSTEASTRRVGHLASEKVAAVIAKFVEIVQQ